MSEARNPWDRRNGETFRQFQAFTLYRDLGPERSLKQLSKTPRVPVGRRTLEKWSGMHDWVDRAAMWDQHLDRVNQRAQIERVKQMRENHANLGGAMITLAATRFKALSEQPDKVRELSIPQATALAKEGVRIERQARGEPDLTVGDADGVPAGLTDRQLWQLVRSNPDLADIVDRLEEAIDGQDPDDVKSEV